MELHDENKKNTRNFENYIENCTDVIYYVNCLNDETELFASSAALTGLRQPSPYDAKMMMREDICMSSRIFQSVIIQMKDATDRVIGVTDNQGFVVACSELSMIGSYLDDLKGLSGEMNDQTFTTTERTYKLIGSLDSQFDYAVFVSGHDATAKSICILAAVAMNEAKTNYEEKHDKATFIKNIISDNILPGDVYVRAKELHFVTDEPRSVLLVRQVDSADVAAMEVIHRLFPDKQRDFVININETDIVVVKALSAPEANEEVLKAAHSVEKALHE